MRIDGRQADELRPVRMITDFVSYPEGSVLIEVGETRVLCNVTVEEGVPRWILTQQKPGGWITAEYSMLPRATRERTQREVKGLGGRTQEIRRLIGRSLRATIDLEKIGKRTFIVDCDVLQADGGTRTAAITGGYVALEIAIRKLIQSGEIPEEALKGALAAVSVGIVDGQALLDLCSQEDNIADVDANLVMNEAGEFIEIQGTAEGHPFTRSRLDSLLDLGHKGILELFEKQKQALQQQFSK